MSTGSSSGAVDQAPRQLRPDAGRLTAFLALALVAFGIAGLAVIDRSVTPVIGWSIPFWGIAILTVGAAFMVFDVEFRRETYTFTFGELVLVVGMFFATPLAFIAGRLLGELAYLSLRERQPARKLMTNLSAYFAESVTLLVTQQLLSDRLDVREPTAWLIALCAVIVAELVGFAAIATVIRWHGGPITLRSIVQIGLLTAPANTSLALIVCILAEARPAAVPLLGAVALFLVLTYRSYSSLRQRYDSLSLLYDFTHLVSGAREPNDVLDAMLTQAKNSLRAERAEFWLARSPGSFQRHVVDDSGHVATREQAGRPIEWLVDRFNDGGDALLLPRGTITAELRRLLAVLDGHDAIVAPIREADSLLGFVVVVNRLSEIYTFEAQDVRVFTTLASHAGVALQNGRLIARLHEQARQREYEALHDPLTGLANRSQFADRLVTRLAEDGHHETIIALMDLDGFKEINDTLGHQSGDAVLVEVGHRLSETAGAHALVVRLGGDEFALLAEPGSTRHEVEVMCHRMHAAIAAPMAIEHVTVNMGVSIGIAVAPVDGHDADSLIRRADVAMYAAKSGKGNGVAFYDPEHDGNTPRRLGLAHDLRGAIEAGHLRAVYQPKVSLADGRVTGVECLSRWDHPTFGQIMPDEFIPLADRTGAIGALTRWMIRTAIEQCERWNGLGLRYDVSVNVSMRNLLDPEMVAIVEHALQASSIEPSQLTLEITETNVMSDAVRTAHVLEGLSALGVRLSIDDFGTGYSSLAYLQRLPVDEVKIDKMFVFGLGSERGSEAIVRSVLDLARNLDLEVVAEGVESAASAERLRALGCETAQGYYFARPMAAEQIDVFAATRVAQRHAVPSGV